MRMLLLRQVFLVARFISCIFIPAIIDRRKISDNEMLHIFILI